MNQNDEYSPDEPMGTEAFGQGDEAIDEQTRLDPDFVEEVEADPDLLPSLQADDRELEEAGAKFDDPENLAVLDGGIDDPDGVAPAPGRDPDPGADGWDLDAGDADVSR